MLHTHNVWSVYLQAKTILNLGVYSAIFRHSYPADTRRPPIVALTMDQRGRRWANIKPPLGEFFVFAVSLQIEHAWQTWGDFRWRKFVEWLLLFGSFFLSILVICFSIKVFANIINKHVPHAHGVTIQMYKFSGCSTLQVNVFIWPHNNMCLVVHLYYTHLSSIL